jgi:outer membrane protein assembly factor BamB
MKTLLISSVAFLIVFSVQAQTPSIAWRFNTHDCSFGNAAIGDIDGDGKPEIVFSCYWGDSCIYALNAEDGSLLWKRNMGGCNDAAPILYDIDNDGFPEVILGSSCNPVLTCFNGNNGTTRWQQPFGGTDSPPSIADIDGDSHPEILVGDFEGYLNCYTLTGVQKWRIPVDTNSAIEASPALVDVNQDGHPDIIVCTWAYGGAGDSTAVYAYDGVTHTLIWKNPIPTDKIYHGAAFADVDEDGRPELAVNSYDGHVYLFNGEDGSLAWQYPTTALSYIGDPVTIGDINNDGHLELVYSNGYGEVDALDRFGALKWSFFMPPNESSFRGASLADVNNDDTLDVVFACSSGQFYALNGSRGNLLWQVNLRADYGDSLYSLEHGALISNFKNDDTLYAFVAGGYTNYPNIQNDFGRAYALKLGKSTGPNWLMFQHDYTRSNCVCTPFPAVIKEHSLPELQVNDFPNPFSDRITFTVLLPRRSFLKAGIYGPDGKCVKVFSEQLKESGEYVFSWDGKGDNQVDLAPGVYFFRVITDGFSAVKKVVRMR